MCFYFVKIIFLRIHIKSSCIKYFPYWFTKSSRFDWLVMIWLHFYSTRFWPWPAIFTNASHPSHEFTHINPTKRVMGLLLRKFHHVSLRLQRTGKYHRRLRKPVPWFFGWASGLVSCLSFYNQNKFCKNAQLWNTYEVTFSKICIKYI